MALDTTITAVAVYTDRARVTRTGATKLEPGNHKLEITELPLALDPASVRAAARGTARARLLGVDVKRRFYAETPTATARELELKIETLQDAITSLDAQIALLKEEREATRKLTQATEHYARGLAWGKTTAADQMTFMDSLRQRAGEIDRSLLALGIQRRSAERELQKLQRELNQLRGAKARERYTAIVEVDVSEAGDLGVELVYMANNAGWTPLYDLRLLENATLESSYLAQVTQQTGENWNDVALTLSTARPALAETLPELDPWYIGPVYRAERHRAAPMPAPMQAVGGMLSAATAADEMKKEKFAQLEEADAEVVTATVESSGAAVTYHVPGVVSVPPDGTPRKVTVARFELAPKLDYVSAPKLVAAAYRRAKVKNDSPYTLLPGPANLFDSDEFIGATELELTAPAGELELYLGVDDRVKIERELKRRDVDKKFIGNKLRLNYGYEIRLENLLEAEAKLTLHDQLPVSRHEEIKVKLEFADPKPTEQTELGLVRWELTLAPGEKRAVRFDFSVEHPKEMQVTGLP